MVFVHSRCDRRFLVSALRASACARARQSVALWLGQWLAIAFLAASTGWLLAAETVAPAVGTAQWQARLAQWLNAEVAQQMQAEGLALPLRAEVEIGTLDSRLRWAACQRVEPYLPPGMRLWGRSRIGLRCTQGPVAWNVFLPIYVRVWGPGWVLRRPVRSGETLTADDATPTEVDWTAYRDSVLVRAQDWQGLQAVRGLAAGQVLRDTLVRKPLSFSAGSVVRVRVEGRGFTIVATGEALGDGRIGESVRVRLANRRVLVGTVVDGKTVSVPL